MSKYAPAGLILGLLALVLGGCATATAPAVGDIICHAASRVSVTEAPTEQDSLRFEGEDSTQSLPTIYLELHAQYWSGAADHERALRLWVTPTGTDDTIVSTLYQLPLDSGPANQFRGGHGFTGLNYAYDLTSGAELQYWCESTGE